MKTIIRVLLIAAASVAAAACNDATRPTIYDQTQYECIKCQTGYCPQFCKPVN